MPSVKRTSLAMDFYQLRLRRPTVGGLARFGSRIVRDGKLAEAISFAYWELLYRCRIQGRIRITDNSPLQVTGDWAGLLAESAGRSTGFRFGSSSVPWRQVHCYDGGTRYGVLYTEPRTLYRHSDSGEQVSCEPIWHFGAEIRSIFVTRNQTVLVSLGNGEIHRYDGVSGICKLVQRLSTSESYLRFDRSVAETDDDILVLAEYGNVRAGARWRSVAYLYLSIDDGLTWSTSDLLVRLGVNKHSHVVRYSARTGTVVLTVGDNKKQVLEGRLEIEDGVLTAAWSLRRRWHIQTGGYTAVADTSSGLIFGSDYHYGTNFIVRSSDCKRFVKAAIPDPYRRSPVCEMTKRTSKSGEEVWANLWNSVSSRAKSLLMVSRDDGDTWQRVIEYDGTANRIYLASESRESASRTSLLLYVTELDALGHERPMRTFDLTAIEDHNLENPIGVG